MTSPIEGTGRSSIPPSTTPRAEPKKFKLGGSEDKKTDESDTASKDDLESIEKMMRDQLTHEMLSDAEKAEQRRKKAKREAES